MQRLDGLRGRRLDRIGHGNDRRNLAIHRRIKRRLAFACQCVALAGQSAQIDALTLHQPVGADEQLAPVHCRTHTKTGDRLELLRFSQRQAPGLRCLDDGFGNGMFRILFHR